MEILKIVVTGAYSAGKSQFIRTISDVDVLETEEGVTNALELEQKDHTTVALDFGTIQVNSDLALYLFGTPGQERFDFMWDILATGCIGYVVLVDSCRPAHFKEAIAVIRYFNRIAPVPFLVVANKQDDPTCLPIEYIRYRLGLPEAIPVVPCVATDRESVKTVLLTLLEKINTLSEN